jgi:hydrogenase nickel incorporation protein HypA/HybF
MHEYALVEAVVATTLNVAEQQSFSRVTSIDVRIGELQSIDPEVVRSAFQIVRPADEPRLEDVRLELEIEPARFRCRACEHDFGLADVEGMENADTREAIHFVPELAHAFLGCPACRSVDFDVVAGRGISIASIEGS